MKYFTQATYTAEELKKEKNQFSLSLHPDRGGDSRRFIEMMNEYKTIQEIITKTGRYSTVKETPKQEAPKQEAPKQETKKSTKKTTAKAKEEKKVKQSPKKNKFNYKEMFSEISSAFEAEKQEQAAKQAAQEEEKRERRKKMEERYSSIVNNSYANDYSALSMSTGFIFSLFLILSYFAFVNVVGIILVLTFSFVIVRRFKALSVVVSIIALLYLILPNNASLVGNMSVIAEPILLVLPVSVASVVAFNVLNKKQ